jgi:DNA-binding response OmpR family regulator
VITLPYELGRIDGLTGPATPARAGSERADVLAGAEPAAGAARVLVVDDDRDLLDLVSIKLRLAGYHVLTATSGPEALRVARSGGPDALVLDIGLPGLTGLDVCFRLRSDVATARTPVLLLTARSAPTDVAMGFALGAKDYMVKPFNTRELVRRVRALLPRDLR